MNIFRNFIDYANKSEITGDYFPYYIEKENEQAENEKYLKRQKVFKEVMIFEGAYCIFKDKYDFLDEIINGRQPDDADAHHIGQHIYPRRVEEIIEYFYSKEILEWKFRPFEGNHGVEIYLEKYKYLLLIKAIVTNYKRDRTPEVKEKSISVIKDSKLKFYFEIPQEFNLRGIDISRLRDFIFFYEKDNKFNEQVEKYLDEILIIKIIESSK